MPLVVDSVVALLVENKVVVLLVNGCSVDTLELAVPEVPVVVRQIRLVEVAEATVQVKLVVVLLSREAVAEEDPEVDLVLVDVLVEAEVDQVVAAKEPAVELKFHLDVELVVATDLACTGTQSWTNDENLFCPSCGQVHS